MKRSLSLQLIIILSLLLLFVCISLGASSPREPDATSVVQRKVTLSASPNSITLPCPPDSRSDTCPTEPNLTVQLTSIATGFGSGLLYTYSVTGGRVTGEGRQVTWDLAGVGPGTYTAIVEVEDARDRRARNRPATAYTTVTIASCPDCRPEVLCASISVSCSENVRAGTNAVFTAKLSETSDLLSYNWTVSAGEIIEGQGTSAIKVRTNGLAGQSVTATVEVSLDPGCARTSSCTTAVKE
jgi:hypothetical protein